MALLCWIVTLYYEISDLMDRYPDPSQSVSDYIKPLPRKEGTRGILDQGKSTDSGSTPYYVLV